MRYVVSLSFVLFAVWLVWSGIFEPLLLGLGVVSCLVVVAFVQRMEVVDHESAPVEITPRAVAYLPWLLWQIVKANFDVARRIIDPRLPISPRVIRVRTKQRRDLARAVFANSITLTPGTVSIDLEGDEIVVHALTREAAEGVIEGEMNRRVRRLEGSG